MIVVHHLNDSRSQRILWLLEELKLPYEIKSYQRDATTRFFALHYAIMIGVLSLVCGAWSVILLFMAGVSGGWFAQFGMWARR